MTATPQTTITVLKHLINDHDPAWVAQATGLPRADVEAIADVYDWPDKDRLRWAVDELSKTAGGAIPVKRVPSGVVHRLPTAAPAPAKAAAPTAPVEAAPAAADTVADLLARAAKSDKARTRNLAGKIDDLLDDLRARLDDEAKAREDAEKAKRERARRDAEIAELEKRIAELKKGRGGGARQDGQDHPCPQDGCDFVGTSAQSLGGHRRYHHRPEQNGDNLLHPAESA